jgi:cation-transporting ATPase 13A3/4/5
VIALATKVLPDLNYRRANTLKRTDVENNLIFLGLLVMQNKLKNESASVIETLNECNIRTVMATGDNIHTSISAARQCQIIQTNSEVYLGTLEKT